MNWRWVSLAALLAALVIGYGAFNDRTDSSMIGAATPPQPGYYLHDAIITETQQDGSLGMRLIAELIEQRPSDDAITLSGVRVNYFHAPGRQWALSAHRGVVPADSRIVHLMGDVVLRPADSPDSLLRTEALTIDTGRNIAYADNSPVDVQFGQHAMTVQSFTADLTSEKVRLESVNGRFKSP